MKLIFVLLFNFLAFNQEGYCRPTTGDSLDTGKTENNSFDDLKIGRKSENHVKKEKKVLTYSELDLDEILKKFEEQQRKGEVTKRIPRRTVSEEVTFPRIFPWRDTVASRQTRNFPNTMYLMLNDSKDDDDDQHYPFHEPI